MTSETPRRRAFVPIENGHTLFVRDWGSGPPILFLAGWGLDSRLWADVMVPLSAQGYRTLAYDRRGAGMSSDPGEVSETALAEDLASIVETIPDQELVIVAHSGGVGEVLNYASRHGESRIRGLIAIGSAGPRILARSEGEPGIPPAMFEAMFQQMEGDFCNWIEANEPMFAPGAYPLLLAQVKDMMLSASRRVLLDHQRLIAEADLVEQARSFTRPVVLIHGDADASTPLELTARRYAELFPRVELKIYEGGGHGLMLSHARRLAADIATTARAMGAST